MVRTTGRQLRGGIYLPSQARVDFTPTGGALGLVITQPIMAQILPQQRAALLAAARVSPHFQVLRDAIAANTATLDLQGVQLEPDDASAFSSLNEQAQLALWAGVQTFMSSGLSASSQPLGGPVCQTPKTLAFGELDYCRGATELQIFNRSFIHYVATSRRSWRPVVSAARTANARAVRRSVRASRAERTAVAVAAERVAGTPAPLARASPLTPAPKSSPVSKTCAYALMAAFYCVRLPPSLAEPPC